MVYGGFGRLLGKENNGGLAKENGAGLLFTNLRTHPCAFFWYVYVK